MENDAFLRRFCCNVSATLRRRCSAIILLLVQGNLIPVLARGHQTVTHANERVQGLPWRCLPPWYFRPRACKLLTKVPVRVNGRIWCKAFCLQTCWQSRCVFYPQCLLCLKYGGLQKERLKERSIMMCNIFSSPFSWRLRFHNEWFKSSAEPSKWASGFPTFEPLNHESEQKHRLNIHTLTDNVSVIMYKL